MPALRYVEVTLTLDTSQYATGDVLASTQEIPLCLRQGVAAELVSLVALDKDDTGQDIDIIFMSHAADIGTENAAISVTDTHADRILGTVSIDMSADGVDLINSWLATKTNIGLVLHGEDASATSLYVAAVVRSGTPTYTASGITLKLGIKDF